MALISDALRQAFMPKHEYECLREEDKAWTKLQRPLLISTVGIICLVIFVSTTVSFKIVFPGDSGKRPFCSGNRLQPLPIKHGGNSDLFPGAFYLTDQETVDYYWMVVFVLRHCFLGFACLSCCRYAFFFLIRFVDLVSVFS
jgi:hypothetical protein